MPAHAFHCLILSQPHFFADGKLANLPLKNALPYVQAIHQVLDAVTRASRRPWWRVKKVASEAVGMGRPPRHRDVLGRAQLDQLPGRGRR